MDRAEWDRTYSEYVVARRPHLRRIAFTLTRDWNDAEDLLQSALVKLYVNWARVRTRGAEDSYVRTILMRTRIDESRRPWRRESPGLEAGREPVWQPDDGAGLDLLVGALLQLPPMQRRCVVLRHWIGLSVREAAGELGVAEGTVKAHTYRGLLRLRELVPTMEEEPC